MLKKINTIYLALFMALYLLFSGSSVIAEQVEVDNNVSTHQAKSEVGIHFTEKESVSTTSSNAESIGSNSNGGGDSDSTYAKPLGRTDLPKAGEAGSEIPMYIGMFMIIMIIVYIIYVSNKKYRKKV